MAFKLEHFYNITLFIGYIVILNNEQQAQKTLLILYSTEDCECVKKITSKFECQLLGHGSTVVEHPGPQNGILGLSIEFLLCQPREESLGS